MEELYEAEGFSPADAHTIIELLSKRPKKFIGAPRLSLCLLANARLRADWADTARRGQT